MPTSLEVSIQELVTKRQSRRNDLSLLIKKCQKYEILYTSYLNWICTNKTKFDEATQCKIDKFENFINEQLSRINTLISQGAQLGTLNNLLARSERTWISLGTVGAKRQGKGHYLSSLMGLEPENDLFLARPAVDACTATIVTLHQGNKMIPLFDKDHNFLKWKTEGTKFAEVKFHSVSSMIGLIQCYFNKIHFDEKFSENTNISVDEFLRLCESWAPAIDAHRVDTSAQTKGDVDFKVLLKEYLEHAKDYKDYLTQNEDIFDIDPLPAISYDKKSPYKQEKLRKYISYYWHDIGPKREERHYAVLAVKQVDVYLPFSIGGCQGNSFVISDSAGVGEAKLDLIQTLQTMLRQDTDLAIAVASCPTEVNGDVTLSGNIKDFHLAIKGCLVDFPTQVYYLINVSKKARETHELDKGIELFRGNIIEHLRNNQIGIPQNGMKRPKVDDGEPDSFWTDNEVQAWEEEHVKIIDCDDSEEIHNYLQGVILPNATKDISFLDTLLLKQIESVTNDLDKDAKNLPAYLLPIKGACPGSAAAIHDEKVEYIVNNIFIPLGKRLHELCCLLTAAHDNNDAIPESSFVEDKQTITDCIKILKQYEAKIRAFYLEPDGQSISEYYIAKNKLTISEDEKRAGSSLKEAWYTSERAERKSREQVYTEWINGILDKYKLRETLRKEICYQLSICDAPTADEIVLLVRYREALISALCTKTSNLISEDISKAYIGMTLRVWHIIYKLGKFGNMRNDNSQIEDETIPDTIVSLLTASADDMKDVIEVLNKLRADTLSESKNKLKEDFDKCMLSARIQPINYDSSQNNTREGWRTHIIPFSFITHLIGIERDYKKMIGRRCQKENVVFDFISRFNTVVGEIVLQLLYEKPVSDDLEGTRFETPAKKSLVRYYVENFEQICPDAPILKKVKLLNAVSTLNEIK